MNQWLLLLLDLTLKSTLLLVLAWGVGALSRKSPTRQRLVWLLAFAAIPVIAIASIALPAKLHLVNLASDSNDTAAILTESAVRSPSLPDWQVWVIALWLMGIVAVLGYAVGCLNALRRLKAGSKPVAEIDLERLSQTSGVRKAWELRVSTSDSPASALTWGWVRPVVLLPRESTEWAPLRTQAVLMHELAHVRRADSIVQAVILVVCAVLWFNPLAWLGAKAFRAAAEATADEAVLSAGVKPSDYASVLLSLLAEMKSSHRSATLLSASMLCSTGIESRIRAIVSYKATSTVSRKHALYGIAIAVLGACALASVRAAAFTIDSESVPDIYKGKSLEWRKGYESAQRYLRENSHTGGVGGPTNLTKEEAYRLEMQLHNSQKS